MSLSNFQAVLGRAVRAPVLAQHSADLDLSDREDDSIRALVGSDGLKFTAKVQRSWSISRASKAAHLTLSFLSSEERTRILDEWVSLGNGTASFFATESDAFLDFISK